MFRRLWSEGILGNLDKRVQDALTMDPFIRTPEWIQDQIPKFENTLGYFRPHIAGLQYLPKTGPYLIIGNHSGGMYSPDGYVLLAAFWRHQGAERELYAMGHNFLFGSPLRDWFMNIGIIPADPRNADRVLDRGAALLIYPGGDHESFRPIWDRNRIDFAGRKGFVKLALKRQIPIVPAVCHGSHHSLIVLTRGQRLAEKIGMDSLRVKIFPFTLSVPWGVVPGWLPSVPLPADINITLTAPLSWPQYDAKAANDKVIVERCFDEVVDTMQSTLDRMVASLPDPLLRLRLRGKQVNDRARWTLSDAPL